ncbi:MAG: phosphoglycerate dehydrogenase, partial [Bdellovibrionales bacterium]|nr:phosphoglycerate dehydrogenase [Bdellovibrionales bacterium]
KIRILLIEQIHPGAVKKLEEAGFVVAHVDRALSEQELLEQITDVHVLGLQGVTRVSEAHFAAAKRLLAVGSFGVNTDQVDTDAARFYGVPVFNAPYGATRSVAELAIGQVFALARSSAQAFAHLLGGRWQSVSGIEIRDKVLGIIGYGHVGQQVGILAEALGMSVVFYDQLKRLPLGNAKQCARLDELLRISDFVTLHVPSSATNEPLLGSSELASVKPGCLLINVSHSSLIDADALRQALESGRLGGVALDVFAHDTPEAAEGFLSGLEHRDRVVLTPHLGPNTEEAKRSMGLEVASAFIKYIDTGSTLGAVNFPQIDLRHDGTSHRILNIHRNVPGVLSDINTIVSEVGANINSQYVSSLGEVAYLVMDVNREVSEEVKQRIAALPSNIKTRILY